MKSPARFALFALPAFFSLASVACTSPVGDSYPDPVPSNTDSVVVSNAAPTGMVGSWQSANGQGSSTAWSFESDGKATHTLVVSSGPDACRKTTTTVYDGSITTSDHTLTFTATSASIAEVDCNGAERSAGVGYSETLTYTLATPTELVLREVSKCMQTDQASKDVFCTATFAKL